MFNVNAVTRVCEYVMRCGTLQVVSECVSSLTGCGNKEDNECPMEVKFALLADYALISRDNKVSILGVFDELRPPMIPFILPALYMVVGFEGSAAGADTDFRVEYLLWGEDGSTIFQREATVRFNRPSDPAARARHNEIMGLHGLPLTVAGDYAFIVRVNGEERSRTVLRVIAPPGGAQQ